MTVLFDERFWRHYDRLTDAERRRINARLVMLDANPHHPSLQVRKWRAPSLWYARVSRDIQMYFEMDGPDFIILAVGHHNIEREM